jgi:hypothetical protein
MKTFKKCKFSAGLMVYQFETFPPVIPAQAGTHGLKNTEFSWIIPLGPRLRGDDNKGSSAN